MNQYTSIVSHDGRHVFYGGMVQNVGSRLISFGLVHVDIGGTVDDAVYLMGVGKLLYVSILGYIQLVDISIKVVVTRLFATTSYMAS